MKKIDTQINNMHIARQVSNATDMNLIDDCATKSAVYYDNTNKQLLQRIRLSDYDLKAITSLFVKYFLTEDKLWIFGSRVEQDKKGGDIDLYVETHANTAQDALVMKNNFLWDLEQMIGEQKIDIVLNILKFPFSLPIYAIAKTKGVRII